MTDHDKPVFAQTISRLAIATRELSPDTAKIRIYFEALKALEIEFVVAAAAVLQDGQWFPKVGEWKDAAAKVERDRLEEQRSVIRKLKTPLCFDCNDTGWADKGDNRVGKCDCARLRRLEVLGRRPMPELPESTTPHVIDVEAVSKALASSKVMR